MASMREQLLQVESAIREQLREANADELAEALGICKSNVYRIRRGGSPSWGTLLKLAQHFDNGEQPEPNPYSHLASMPGRGPAKPPVVDPPAPLD